MLLAPIDLVIIAAYLVAAAAIGLWFAKQTNTADDLFLAGRSLGFAVVGLSLFASNISSTTLIGVTGAAYSSGINVAHYELMAAIILIVMTFLTIPVFLRCRLTTIPEYLERRFGPLTCKYVSALTLMLSILVDTAGSVYAGVLVLQTFAPSVPFVAACVVLACIAGIYTAAGGLRAVVYTDVLQTFVLLLGTTILAWNVWAAFDFDWAKAVASTDAEHLSLIRPLDNPHLPWLGVVIGLPVLGFYYWGTNQYVMQRVLGAKSLDHARWGANLAALLKVLPLFLLALPAAFAFALLPPLENPDLVFGEMIKTFVPVGLTGLILAGLVAALMSTIDSTLNSASTLVVRDFIGAHDKGWPEADIVRLGRLITVGLMIVAALWPLVIREFPGLFSYIQQVFSYAVPPVAAVFLLGLLWRGTTELGAIVTLVLGHTCGLLIMAWRAYAKASGAADGLPHFTIVAGLTCIACLFIGVIVSTLSPRAVEVDELTLWQPSDTETSERGWRDYRLQGAATLFIVLICVLAFW
jgi:SSS family solute:Na+ symporter